MQGPCVFQTQHPLWAAVLGPTSAHWQVGEQLRPHEVDILGSGALCIFQGHHFAVKSQAGLHAGHGSEGGALWWFLLFKSTGRQEEDGLRDAQEAACPQQR